MDVNANNQNAGCAQVANALSAHFDGVADETARRQATAHLQSCPDCARMWMEWQELKALEQSALQPLPDNYHGTVPLAPVVPPRHLASSILQRTSHAAAPLGRFTFIGKSLWPRLALGAAVPAFAAACWALWTFAPQTVSVTDNAMIHDPAPPAVAALPVIPNRDTVDSTNKDSSNTVASPAAPQQVTEIDVSENKSHEEREDKTATSPPAHLIAASTDSARRKSTFTRSSHRKRRRPNRRKRTLALVRKPQVSVASLEQPQSRATTSLHTNPAPAMRIATAPIRVSAPQPAETLLAAAPHEAEMVDPVVEYIAAHDVRPDTIRQAVDNYRAALLTVHLDDSEL